MPIKPSPSFKPADLVRRQDPGVVEFDFSFRFITPMFGGGVESNGPQKPFDPQTPIRVPSIRGQLRFWWRACNPEGAKTIEDLREKEAQIWGSTTVPSSVTIAIKRGQDNPTPCDVYQKKLPREGSHPGAKPTWAVTHGCRDIAYGLFPLKPDEGSSELPGKLAFFDGDRIVLAIRCSSSHERGVREALKAWSLFGGLGARTRRGFGAIESADDYLTIDTAKAFLRTLEARPVVRGQDFPSLIRATLETRGAPSEARGAWAQALAKLSEFRQHRRRNASDLRKPGRSFWPEPEQIRDFTDVRDPRHQQLSNPVLSYPRAAFGLPIVFHFQSKQDPPDSILVPAGLNRFASPLILRPLRDDSGAYRAIALLLSGSEVPMALEISAKKLNRRSTVRRSLTPAEALLIPQLANAEGNSDPLQAFLYFFSQSKP